MKTILLTTTLLLSISLFSQEIKSEVSLAGTELKKYKNKKVSSLLLIAGGGLLAFVSTTDEQAKPMLYIGGLMSFAGITVNISSLSNLGKASKHLIEFE